MIEIRDCALRLITFRDRTEKELREKLSEKGYEETKIEEEIEFLKSYGYIDDKRYASRFISDAIKIKKWGKLRIRTELLRRGIKEDDFFFVLEEALCEGSTDVIEEEIKRRFKNSDLSNIKERRRIFNFFLRRGFNSTDIKGEINRVSSFCDVSDDVF